MSKKLLTTVLRPLRLCPYLTTLLFSMNVPNDQKKQDEEKSRKTDKDKPGSEKDEEEFWTKAEPGDAVRFKASLPGKRLLCSEYLPSPNHLGPDS
ncbi:unnamed protein product [Nippostrongylus brasiliensis]|uniref:Secreted protein n=1 Tax=Nippostrongylus brasiliensis TaxID=27835 RepID=A0A0N4XM69_NIPBR|nr:unnamed protein product [Nippostrongylus brasiliensis]